MAAWVTGLYPSTGLRGVMFGASNGGAIHLAAALGMAWLPQTYLVAVRRHLQPGEALKDIEWGRRVVRPLLDRFPQLHAAQMHDPVQDRLMVSKMGYFRLKLLGLPTEFKAFLSYHTAPKKPIISIECELPWPATSVGNRHTFQLGGFGSVDPYEYLNGSDRTRKFLKEVGARKDHWDTFKPTGEMPESEWGFYPEVLNDLREKAQATKAPFYRLRFIQPEDVSAFACDLYRFWYEQRLGLKSQRILIENFAIMSPYRAIVSGALPFWLAFNTECSAEVMEKYLDSHPQTEELYLALMSNGVDKGIGLTTIERWQEMLKRATRKGCFVGVDQKEYPLDFGTFLRYGRELKKMLPDQFLPPEPLTIDEVKAFLEEHPNKYPLTLTQDL
jgi:hypothetical protein